MLYQGVIVYEIIFADQRIDDQLPYTNPTVHYDWAYYILAPRYKNSILAAKSSEQSAMRTQGDAAYADNRDNIVEGFIPNPEAVASMRQARLAGDPRAPSLAEYHEGEAPTEAEIAFAEEKIRAIEEMAIKLQQNHPDIMDSDYQPPAD